MKKVVEASMAMAIAVKMCRPKVIPMYPITPQTHIVERIADFINDGEFDAEMIHVESEHSAISAGIGSAATGVRTFTATASQGLALMHEILHIVSALRLPIVMGVANRALSGPINIWNDHQDSISARDTGWIQLYCESSQEVLDTTIQAYKIAENRDVMLPVMVCLDGFTLSHVYEPVDVPEQKSVDKFLPKFKPSFAYLDPKKPMSIGPIGFPDSFMDFKYDQQDAMATAIKVIQKTHKEFSKKFGREYGNGLIETYKLDDADYAVVGMGTICGTARVVVDQMRSEGHKVGLIKVKSYRPFPEQEMFTAAQNLKGMAVIDRDLSYGSEGALYTDIRSALYDSSVVINSFIGGLGGKDVTPDHIRKALENCKRDAPQGWLF